jgi:glycosyltransferase involved in cell wall biosynthesis
MSKIRVCHIVCAINGGGVEQVILNYASKIKDQVDFDIIYQYPATPAIRERFENLGFQLHEIVPKKEHPFSHIRQIYQILKKNSYDVVHCHLDWYLNFIPCFLALICGIKIRVSHHHQVYQSENTLLKMSCGILRILNKITATHYMACGIDAAKSAWGETSFKQGEVIILPNAIKAEKFYFNQPSRDKIRKELGVEHKFCIGHIGRFYPQKNHIFLIDIFAEIHTRIPESFLMLLGNGPLLPKIQNKIKDLNLLDSVLFLGIQQDTAPFYHAMDVFCLPSLWEGLPVVLIEAQISGLPCIASVIIDKKAKLSENCTFMNTQRSPQDWAEQIMSMRQIKRGEPINQTILKSYNIDETYPILKNVYFSQKR